MRRTLISLLALILVWTSGVLALAQAPGQGVVVRQSSTDEKNSVEVAIDEAKKRGDVVMGACLHDCGEKAESSDKSIKGEIIELPKPAYPPLARAARASGAVEVQVLIDTDGTVVAAAAISGHPLLMSASVSAARRARFKPMLYEGMPVKVTGIILYTFITQ